MKGRRWLIIAVVVVLVAAALWIFNRPSTGKLGGDPATGPQAFAMMGATGPAPTAAPAPAINPKNDIATHTLTNKGKTKRGNCQTYTVIETWRNGFGNFLFSWNQTASWCVNAGHTGIVNYSFAPFAKFGTQLWNLWGCGGCPSGITPGGNTTYRYQRADAQMKACVTPFVCETEALWVSQTLRADGSYTPDGGGQ